MSLENKIEIWKTFPKVLARKNPRENRIKAKVTRLTLKSSSEYLESMASRYRRPQDTPDLVPYLVGMVDDVVFVEGKPFTYASAFNRNPELFDKENDVNKHKLLQLGIHAHVVTSDNKLVYGFKKNQGNQITGFGGFPNVATDVTYLGRDCFLHFYKAVMRKLQSELGPELSSSVKRINMLGITHVSQPGLRGCDISVLVESSANMNTFNTHFKESEQFQKPLMYVNMNPDTLPYLPIAFKDYGEISPYALATLFLVTGFKFGPDVQKNFTDSVSEASGIEIKTNERPKYLLT